VVAIFLLVGINYCKRPIHPPLDLGVRCLESLDEFQFVSDREKFTPLVLTFLV
jgi:hypothetical protein